MFYQKYNLQWLLLAIAVVVMDQVSKYVISMYLIPSSMVHVLPFFSLFYVFNTGAAFSFLENANGWQEWLFSGLAIAVSLAIVYWLIRAPLKKRTMTKFSLMLIMGGAIGNLIDRLCFGYVRDFLYFSWHEFSWPSFNVADSAICIGACILIIGLMHKDSKQ